VKREICDADEVPVREPVAMSIQSVKGSLEQARGNLGSFGSCGRRPFDNDPSNNRRWYTG